MKDIILQGALLTALVGLVAAVPTTPTARWSNSTSSSTSSSHASPAPSTPTAIAVSVPKTASSKPTGSSSVPHSVITPGVSAALHKLEEQPGSSSGAVLFSSSGAWLTVPCNAPGMTDIRFGPAERWKTADAQEAWDQAMAGFVKDLDTPGNQNQTFDTWAFNAFHSRDYPMCWSYMSSNCGTVTCDEAGGLAAGFLILNSLAGLHNAVNIAYQSLMLAQDIVTDSMASFVSTFTSLPDQTNSEAVKWILDSLSFVVGIGSAFSWNVFIKEAKIFSDDNYRGAWKDIFNGAIAYGINFGKDSLSAPSDPKATLSEALTSIQGEFLKATVDNLSGFLENTMAAADQQTRDYLTTMVQNGDAYQFLNMSYLGNGTGKALRDATVQLMWGRLISVAWQISPKKMNPFILRVDHRDYKCGSPVEHTAGGFPLGDYILPSTAAKTQWCDPQGNTWFLLNANYDCDHGRNTPNGCLGQGQSPILFQELAGGTTDTLDGKQWGGITLEDIITSSYAGFLANGGKNGYGLADNTSLVINKDWSGVVDGGLPFIGGIRTPGFFNYTICLNLTEAVENIDKKVWPPCGTVPNSDGVSPSVNQQGYAPGWCGIHISQYQKNDLAANPLPEYQAAISIFDGAGNALAYATKQPIDPAIIIKSKLPYDLIVADSSKGDDLCFWYGDQYWCTDDTNVHHCVMGGWDGATKARQGNCGFSCPNPTSNPPKSATEQVPKGAVTAYMGTGTATATAVPPVKTYAKGSCGLHVRQYQKNEFANSLNPSPDYALEMALYDGKMTLIAYMEKTYAPQGQWLSVQGPLQWQVQASTGAVDSDPVYMRYGAQSWNSNSKQCSGDWFNNGYRDIACRFDC